MAEIKKTKGQRNEVIELFKWGSDYRRAGLDCAAERSE